MLSSHQSPITTSALSTSPTASISRSLSSTNLVSHDHSIKDRSTLGPNITKQQQQQLTATHKSSPSPSTTPASHISSSSSACKSDEQLQRRIASSKQTPHQQQQPQPPILNQSTHPVSMSPSSAEAPVVGPKIISRTFLECSTGDIIVLVSSMLQELVNLNDALPFDASQLTRFHSRSPPSISVKDYLIRITKFCSLEKSILLAMIYYIDLLCTTYKIFNINSLTVHRFLITAAMVASKGLCDTFCTNTHYAKVGGLSKLELNSLEVEFLIRVDYRIVPEVERLDQYFERMVMRMNGKYKFAPLDQPKSAATVVAHKQQNHPYQQHPHPNNHLQSSNDPIKGGSNHTAPSPSPSASTSSTSNRSSSSSSSSSKYPSRVMLPSEIAQHEGRPNCSSPLKRPSHQFRRNDDGYGDSDSDETRGYGTGSNGSSSFKSRSSNSIRKLSSSANYEQEQANNNSNMNNTNNNGSREMASTATSDGSPYSSDEESA